MKIPILSGIYADKTGNVRASYPVNMRPVPMPTGVNDSYLQQWYGIDKITDTLGFDRGGINWNDTLYRVFGTKLVKVSAIGSFDVLGDVGSGGNVKMTYSFDRLAINSGDRLYYWDGSTFEQVTDPDLGKVNDVEWVDGYFMTTDGEFIVVTELNDPMSVNPLKYGSAESDPDPIQRVIRLNGQMYAIGRYSTEVFRNVGGSNFPFQVVRGATSARGCVGNRAACVYNNVIFMVGSGRNEDIGVYAVGDGGNQKISSQDIDRELNAYPPTVLKNVLVESFQKDGELFFMIHLPDKTFCYDIAATQILGYPAWFVLSSGVNGAGIYRARNHVRCYGRWWVGDPKDSKLGVLTDKATQWGEVFGWSFATQMLYLDAHNGLIHKLELIAQNGAGNYQKDNTIYTQYSDDGISWSQPAYANAGRFGSTRKRIMWLLQGMIRQVRVQRFFGVSDAKLTVHCLDVEVEALYV